MRFYGSLAGVAFVALLAVGVCAQDEKCPINSRVRGHENVEWSTGYSYHLTDDLKELPRVLIIGDSICNGYQPFVHKRLKGKVNVSYWVSSYCVTSPAYLKLLDVYLGESNYDVVHFNNGLHSLGVSPKEWGRGLEAALKLIRKRQPRAKIIWATSTPLRTEEGSERVRKLNAVGTEVTRRLGGIIGNDLFGLINPLDRATNWTDDYHHVPGLYEREADQVAGLIAKTAGVSL